MFTKNSRRRISEYVYTHLVWVFLVLSISLLFLAYIELIPNAKLNSIINKIGLALFSSGVFAAVLKSIQFTGIFKEEIEKIILGTDFVENRKDLPELWKKISQSLYHSKFPDISHQVQDRILTTYFPTYSEYYYEDYLVTINIHKITRDLDIEYTQTAKFKVKLDKNIQSTHILQRMNIKENENSKEKTQNKLEYIKIDGKRFQITPNEVEPTEEQDSENTTYTSQTVKIPLEGKKEFQIETRYKRRYSLKGENYKLFRLSTFTKNMDVTIHYPMDVGVSFFNVGNVSFFEKNHEDIPNLISRSHKNDVILPYQGFGISFDKY